MKLVQIKDNKITYTTFIKRFPPIIDDQDTVWPLYNAPAVVMAY